MDVSGQLYVLAALARGKSPTYPLDGRPVSLRTGLDAIAKGESPIISPAGN
jgi:hypothetical protein